MFTYRARDTAAGWILEGLAAQPANMVMISIKEVRGFN